MTADLARLTRSAAPLAAILARLERAGVAVEIACEGAQGPQALGLRIMADGWGY